MSNGVQDLSLIQLSLAYVFILVVLTIVRCRKINREKDILVSCVRMTVQLTVMGFVLLYVFQHASWWLTGIMIAIMLSFAVYNVFKRCKYPLTKNLKLVSAGSLIFGCLCTILFFLLAVIQIRPWYNPQYFIPISGMIVGNSMTGVALGLNKLCGDMKEKSGMIENSLMLGASPRVAVREIANSAFDSAMLPTINNMLSMGIISLPGMMTGQILSGTLPITAIKYQIGIMLAILGSNCISSVLLVVLGQKSFFTRQQQLIRMKQPSKD